MNKQKLIHRLNFQKYDSPCNEFQKGYNSALEDLSSWLKSLDERKRMEDNSTPTHYQGTIQPIDLITSSWLNSLDERRRMKDNTTPPHYQGSIQPIDLINAQDLNFNLGNVVKYVCRAGKKQGEHVLSDLDKAKNYINYEIERIKKNE